MKRITHVLLPLFVMAGCGVSDTEWKSVQLKLADIRVKDELYRKQMDSIGRTEGWYSTKIEPLLIKQRSLDSANFADVESIIDRYGYPPKAKVGDQSETPFVVLQHTSDSIQATYQDLIVGAGKNGDLPMKDVAQYQDRVLMMERHPQRYGTQVFIEFKEDKVTGEKYDSLYLWPVRDQLHINERRLAVGLDSLEEHLRRFGIDPTKGYLIRRSPSAATQGK